MQRIRYRQIVDEPAFPAQQRAVLDPGHAPADELIRWDAVTAPARRIHVV